MTTTKDVMPGRRMIMTDAENINENNIIEIISRALIEHQENVNDELTLLRYERGVMPILERKKDIRSDINERIVKNKASEIVDIHVGYCFSNPITFVQRAKVEPTKKQEKTIYGFIKKKTKKEAEVDDIKIANLNKMMYEQSKNEKDIQLARNMFITGVGYQYVWFNRNKNSFSPFEIAVPDPTTTFVIYSNDAFREPLIGCTYSSNIDTGEVKMTAYTKDKCFVIGGVNNSLNLVKFSPNILKQIPIVEFALTDRMGVFEKVMPLIDALNLIDSDRINDIAQHVQSLLWMHNCNLDSDEKKKLIDGDGVIMTKSNGEGREAKIAYLSQTLNQSELQTFANSLKEDIQQITATPSWQEASGGSTTGAMQLSNGWQCLEISAKTVEQLFTKPEMQILELAIECIKASNDIQPELKEIELSDIEIRFCRTKTYDLVSKANSLTTLLNAGVDGLTAFNTVGLFTDPQQAWCDSQKVIEGMQDNMIKGNSNNATKDDEGNGGENNEPKEKTEESIEPSKVAMVED